MSITLSRIVPLNLGLFQTPGNIWLFLETYFVVTTGEDVSGIYWVGSKDTAKCSTKDRTVPDRHKQSLSPMARVPRLGNPVLAIFRNVWNNALVLVTISELCDSW